MDCLDEDSVLAFVEGSLNTEARAKVESHADGCAACADLIAATAGGTPEALSQRSLGAALSEAERLPVGATVGRYLIVGLVGHGGMGDVYAAYDPRLERKVALKLLREARDGSPSAAPAQERLLREAQAIARLSHRNVVVVHDAGTINDQKRGARVYLAMEFIDGRTLAAWLGERARTWREIRDVFVAAGQGLLAAHQAGLVHRDFKPQNVMIGRDGTVRVMDFGLARDASNATGEDGPALDLTAEARPTPDTLALTRAGALLGTPLYMAPEQFQARKADARTDQFSFCVALFEGLFGEHPFDTSSLSGLASSVAAGRVREPTQKGRVPAFLRRILLRGLQTDPAVRYPSMGELLSALRADPVRRRRMVAVGVAAGLVGVAALAGARQVAARGQRMCLGAAERLVGIWETEPEGARRTAVHRAFVATGSTLAEETWTRVSSLLDDYARGWSAAYTDACSATHMRGDQSSEVLDLRMSCLDSERGALRALTGVLAQADRRAVIEAVNAANALPPLDRCADVSALRAAIPPPGNIADRAQVAALEARLADVKALSDTGKWLEARRRVIALEEEAQSLGYRPLLAGVLAAHAWLETEIGDLTTGTRLYERTLWVALASRRDDLAAESASEMTFYSSIGSGLSPETAQWEALTAALMKRLGPGHDRSIAWFHEGLGIAFGRRGDFTRASSELDLALALKRRSLSSRHPDVGITLYTIASMKAQMGEGETALRAGREAVEIIRAAYGDGNPLVAVALDNRGVAFEALHRHAEAEQDLRVALADMQVLYGNDHLWTSSALTDLAKTLEAEGRFREAAPMLERALRIRERSDPTSPDLAETRFALAQAHWALGQDRKGAVALAVAARDAYGALPGYAKWTAEVGAWLAARRTVKAHNHP